MPCRRILCFASTLASRSQIGIGGLVLDFKAAIHLYSIPFHLPQNLFFNHPFKSKNQAHHSLEAPKCATTSGGRKSENCSSYRRFSIPSIQPPTRRISSFLPSSRGLNMADSLILPLPSLEATNWNRPMRCWILSSLEFHRFE
ncbi:hypothetical protein AVEN_194275-1 [Araneus ventricosus]|uniref:Uncharacterized protein n=1 Tax=Araneus ventricosus TaxID=182803 RepID=A0A4Y2G1S3_ARAVE|nr:hypothetical protein AVEN_194275-1 [Araneus ventricosus]